MEERLKRNICDLDDYVILEGVQDLPTCQKVHIGDALEYSCQFWANHLTEDPSGCHNVEEIHRAVDKFFTMHLLSWIEVLAIMGSLGIGVYCQGQPQA